MILILKLTLIVNLTLVLIQKFNTGGVWVYIFTIFCGIDFTLISQKIFLVIPCSTNFFRRFFSNIIDLPEHRNKRKSVLEITKMYYFKI